MNKLKSFWFIGFLIIGMVFFSQSFAQTPSLTTSLKKKIFKSLVAAEDRGVTEPQVYTLIAKRYGITASQAEAIADEGIRNMWPTD